MQLDDRSNAKSCYQQAVNFARSAASSSMEPAHCYKKKVFIARSLYKLSCIHREEGSTSKALDDAKEAIQFGLLDLSVLPPNESACGILTFMMLLYQDKGDEVNVQIYCRRIAELEMKDDDEGTGRPKKRTKLFGARAA